VETKPTKSKSRASSWALKPLSESVIAAQERKTAIASLDVIEGFYRLKPLERCVVEGILKQLRGEKTVFIIDRPLPLPPATRGEVAEEADEEPTGKGKERTGRKNKTTVDTPEEALSRLAYYHRPVVGDQLKDETIEWHTHWLCGYSDLEGNKTLVSIEKKFLPHLRVLKTYLARRSFNARFTSQYSVRLYEWAWQHRRAGLIRITLDELRRVLGVNESRNEKGVIVGKARLTLWPNLKQRALMRAVNEITKKSDLTIKVVTYGREKYRKVTAVAFQILEKAKETVGS
jgi:Initiator Replication protein